MKQNGRALERFQNRSLPSMDITAFGVRAKRVTQPLDTDDTRQYNSVVPTSLVTSGHQRRPTCQINTNQVLRTKYMFQGVPCTKKASSS